MVLVGAYAPVTASHVKVSFNGGVKQSTGNFNGYLLDEVAFDGSTAVPEPSTFLLAALGLLGLMGIRRRRNR